MALKGRIPPDSRSMAAEVDPQYRKRSRTPHNIYGRLKKRGQKHKKEKREIILS
jgi:hypothetical protein